MDDDELQSELEQIAAEYDRDLEDVQNLYEEQLERIGTTTTIGVSEEEYREKAVPMTRSNVHSLSRTGSTGEAEEIPILAIGSFGTWDEWGDDNDTVMIGVGVAAPPDTDEENRVPGVGVFVMKESLGIDIGRAKDLWKWGNHIRGWFAVSKMDTDFKARDRTYYSCETTDRSKLEDAEFEGSLPTDPVDVRQFLAENYVKESFTLETIGENLSLGREGDDFGSGWADLRRFEGQVVDYYQRLPEDCDPSEEENPFGKYTLIDDTVASPEELEQRREVVTEDDVENRRVPGLQVFLPPHMIEYGNDSTLEVYGTLSKKNEETGQITMDGAGVAPVIPFPKDDDSEGEDHDDVESGAL